MKTVNIKNDYCTHYCGRASSYSGHGEDFSILGNPYPVEPWGPHSLEESLRLYRIHLNNERLKNSPIWEAVLKLPNDAVLGCFCKPNDCHCDIIIQAREWVESTKGQ